MNNTYYSNDFSETQFLNNFQAKNDKSMDVCRLHHVTNRKFKLFPYTTTYNGTKAKKKVVISELEDLEEIVLWLFKFLFREKIIKFSFDDLCEQIIYKLKSKDDTGILQQIIAEIFYPEKVFRSNTIELYKYCANRDDVIYERTAWFLYCVLGIQDAREAFVDKINTCSSMNVLEELVYEALSEISNTTEIQPNVSKKFYCVLDKISEQFKQDFLFMLKTEMTSLEELTNLISLYYFYYVSQSSFVLDSFFSGKRDQRIPMYYALDWEKVSKNRKCCTQGWESLKKSVHDIFSHAVTLELLNQFENSDLMFDYIAIKNEIDLNPEIDSVISERVKKIEQIYINYIGDFREFDKIPYNSSEYKTESAIRHLFECVQRQFLFSVRNKPYQDYGNKFEEFCKKQWLKNRRKAGYVLNLTEEKIIFLTKLCLRDNEKIRLNQLFHEFEKRGIFLDNISRELIQNYFTKLNLIEKKSDSGDAQYVKRIL